MWKPLLAVLVAVAALAFGAGAAGAGPYTIGDVFAGVGSGHVKEYTPAGAFVQTLDTLSNSSEDTGMCFDGNTALANLRTTNFTDNTMSRIPQSGATQYPWGGPFNQHPESCVVSVDPNTLQTVVYVGQADGSGDVLKFDLNGNLLASYNVGTQNRGSDWIDLSADKCTLLYTSEGNAIKRFDVCTNTQLSDFATGLPAAPCFALRIRANGEVMVACSTAVLRLSPTGTVIQTYPVPVTESSYLFAMNLDPDGTSFWTAGYTSGNIYHYDITTGLVLDSFAAALDGPTLAGLAVFGEPIVSQPPACGTVTTVTLSPPAATNDVGTSHTVTATVDDNCAQPVANVTVYFTVTRVPPPGTSGTCTTDSSGTCSFTYQGPILPASDTITGCAGANGGPPCGTATKEWVLPVSSPLCTIDITQGGWIIANDGDKASFGGTAFTDNNSAPSGQEQYTDKGASLDVHSIDVKAITCSSNLERADIYGTATINGAGNHVFRIEVSDPDSTSGSDTYWITLDSGYDSGSHSLGGGHVEIHHT